MSTLLQWLVELVIIISDVEGRFPQGRGLNPIICTRAWCSTLGRDPESVCASCKACLNAREWLGAALQIHGCIAVAAGARN